VIVKFLGNLKDPQYEQTMKTILEKLLALGCNISLKLDFLHSNLHYFPENLGALSEEWRGGGGARERERFDQDIKGMEGRYQVRWDVAMMADYSWCLTRDNHQQDEESRKKNIILQASVTGVIPPFPHTRDMLTYNLFILPAVSSKVFRGLRKLLKTQSS
jgi:hypothetical protein